MRIEGPAYNVAEIAAKTGCSQWRFVYRKPDPIRQNWAKELQKWTDRLIYSATHATSRPA